MRSTQIDMNGYRHCLHSKNPYLNGPKLRYFEKRAKTGITLAKTAIEFAPNPAVRRLIEDVEKEYVDLFGPLSKSQQIVAHHFLSLAQKEHTRRETEGYSRLRDVPLERFAYHGGG